MKEKAFRIIPGILLLFIAVVLTAKAVGPGILKMYVEYGIGSCQKIPVLCMQPSEEIVNISLEQEFILRLVPYKFPKMEVLLPKGFTVTQERIRKVYYKKRLNTGAKIYLLQEEKDFFINLFSRFRKQGINDNYEFIRRIMYSDERNIKNLDDVFFVVMKGIFTSDIGSQKSAVMAKFSYSGKRGFINYNLSKPDQYFDCNIIDSEGRYFKVYIKDAGARLDLNKVMAIISTIKAT